MRTPSGLTRAALWSGSWGKPIMSWRSIRARPRRAPSCSTPMRAPSRSRSGSSTQHYPARGWVEHDPEQIWQDTLAVAREALATSTRAASPQSGSPTSARRSWSGIARLGSRSTAAIVWQDRRTAEVRRAEGRGRGDLVRDRTGLLLDPYFSATKIAWILDNVAGARERAERGELACGTIDCFLLWRLTGGAVHATDATNASRTSLFDIHAQRWDAELCRLFRVPEAMLPEVHDNSRSVRHDRRQGCSKRQLPIAGMAGDQQAALFGQACFAPGMVKSTYGTGCFMLVNTGERAVDVRASSVDHPGLPVGRPHHLRARRIDLRRRSGDQMAARRPRSNRPCV